MAIKALERYKDVGGKPRVGVHKWRLMGDVAAFDYIGTIVLALLTTWLFGVPIEISTIGWMAASVGAHLAFGVDTSSTRWLRSLS